MKHRFSLLTVLFLFQAHPALGHFGHHDENTEEHADAAHEASYWVAFSSLLGVPFNVVGVLSAFDTIYSYAKTANPTSTQRMVAAWDGVELMAHSINTVGHGTQLYDFLQKVSETVAIDGYFNRYQAYLLLNVAAILSHYFKSLNSFLLVSNKTF